MVKRNPIESYRAYLDFIEAEAGNGQLSGEEYLQVLPPAEASDLLAIRDAIYEMSIPPSLQLEVERLDDLLIKHRQLITDNVPAGLNRDSRRWWWHLADGPQVRDQALRAS